MAPKRSTSPATGRRKSIAIIGGGLTGLVAAKQLQAKGFAVTVFEDDARLGGHIKTEPAFDEGLFCEAGAELISGKHEHIIGLAKELGVELEPFASSSGSADTSTLLHFKGKIITQGQFEEAFAVLAKAITRDEDQLYLRTEQPISRAREIPWNRAKATALDAMSLKDYLAAKQRELHAEGHEVPDWLIAAVSVAYGGEIGQDADKISALTFVTMLNTSLLRSGSAHALEMPGEEDQIYRVRGGNEELISALVNRVLATTPAPDRFHDGGNVIRHSTPVTHVNHIPGNRVSVTYQTHGQQWSEQFDGLVTTMSMSSLRQIPGIQDVLKKHSTARADMQAINTMQESDVSKITLQTRTLPAQLLAKLNDGKPHEGIIYTDTGPQTIWVSSVNQRTSQGQTPRTGLITCYVCGETSRLPAKEKAAMCENAIVRMLREADPSVTRDTIFNGHAPVVSDWTGKQEGCFVSPAPNQFLPLCNFEPNHGNIVTTGSFIPVIVNNPTNDEGIDIDIQLGYMNNAVKAGSDAAEYLSQYFSRRQSLLLAG